MAVDDEKKTKVYRAVSGLTTEQIMCQDEDGDTSVYLLFLLSVNFALHVAEIAWRIGNFLECWSNFGRMLFLTSPKHHVVNRNQSWIIHLRACYRVHWGIIALTFVIFFILVSVICCSQQMTPLCLWQEAVQQLDVRTFVLHVNETWLLKKGTELAVLPKWECWDECVW